MQFIPFQAAGILHLPSIYLASISMSPSIRRYEERVPSPSQLCEVHLRCFVLSHSEPVSHRQGATIFSCVHYICTAKCHIYIHLGSCYGLEFVQSLRQTTVPTRDAGFSQLVGVLRGHGLGCHHTFQLDFLCYIH